MAISDVQPLFLLLATLFFLPALHAVDFIDCGGPLYLVNVSSVDIIPYPLLASFKISGYTSETITGGYIRLGVIAGSHFVVKKKYDVCEVVACPVAPGPIMFLFNKILPSFPELRTEVGIGAPSIMCVNFIYVSNHPVDAISA